MSVWRSVLERRFALLQDSGWLDGRTVRSEQSSVGMRRRRSCGRVERQKVLKELQIFRAWSPGV